ncbi:hypothetical protein J6590_028202, partial [Homalodisca vitripennis]
LNGLAVSDVIESFHTLIDSGVVKDSYLPRHGLGPSLTFIAKPIISCPETRSNCFPP